MKNNKKSYQILTSHLKKIQKENSKFSVRSLSLKVGVSHAFLTNVLNGKKLLPLKRLTSICNALKIDEFDRTEIEKKLFFERTGMELGPTKESKKSVHEELLPESHLRVLRYWWNLAIIDLLQCFQKKGMEKEEILKYIPIQQHELDISLNELMQLKLIILKDKCFFKSDEHLRIPTRGPNPISRQFYKSTLGLAQKILDKTSPEDFEKRFITHISCSVNPKKIPEAKIKLAEALSEIRDILTEGECSEVYFLQAQLFSVLK